MNENVVKTESNSFFTVKMILRILATICIVVVFCPTFLVSCAGEDINVSAMTAIEGVSMDGEEIVEPQLGMLICIIIPAVILVLLFVKNFTEKKTAGIILGCTVVDLIIWLVFRAKVKEIAELSYCSFKVTGWFVINIASLLIMIVLSYLVLTGKCIIESDLRQAISGGKIQGAGDSVSNAGISVASSAVPHMTEKKETEMRICPKCGKVAAKGNKYCISCGAALPENITVQPAKQEPKE